MTEKASATKECEGGSKSRKNYFEKQRDDDRKPSHSISIEFLEGEPVQEALECSCACSEENVSVTDNGKDIDCQDVVTGGLHCQSEILQGGINVQRLTARLGRPNFRIIPMNDKQAMPP
jgi:hypothetical protein